MATVVFDFEDVSVTKGDTEVLTSVDVNMSDGGITVIVGPSGSGKTTLLRLCNRLEVPTTGTIRYRGRDLDEVDPLELRREVGMVFQRPVALPGTVADNLREGAPHATDAEIDGALERVGLVGTARRRASDLSGGEAQRMSIARTLMCDPRFVLFDEPTSSLDPAAVTGIEQIALDLAAEGTPSAWVTHDLDQVRRLADDLVVVIAGTVVQAGPVESVLDDPVPAVASFLAGGGS